MSFRPLLMALMLWGTTIRAGEAPGRLDINELIAEAIQRNPEIIAAQQRYEAARQKPRQEGSLPNPVLSSGYSSVANPWPVAGLGTWQVSHFGFTMSQELPFPGKRGVRAQMACREADAEFQQYQMTKLRVVAQLKQAYRRLQYANAAIDVLQRRHQLLRKFLDVIPVALVTVQGAQEAQLSLLETRTLIMEQERKMQELEINSLLNRAPDMPLARPVELEGPALPAALGDLLARADSSAPLLRREQKKVEQAELALRLARKDYYPDYRISAGYFNMGQMPALYEFRVDFSLPAYFWRKQRREAAEQAYHLNSARRNYQAVERTLEAQIKSEYLRAETSSRLARMYTENVLPQLNLAVEASLAAYQAGTLDVMPLLGNFMTLVESELSYYEQVLISHLAVTRIEELTGSSLSSWQNSPSRDTCP